MGFELTMPQHKLKKKVKEVFLKEQMSTTGAQDLPLATSPTMPTNTVLPTLHNFITDLVVFVVFLKPQLLLSFRFH